MTPRRFTRRVRGTLRRDPHGLLHGGPPTQPALRPIGPEVPSDSHVQQVLDLCMQVGEVLLSSGENAEETTARMLRISAAAGLPTVDVDITFTSITMCCHRGNAAAPVTSMRLIRYRTLDLSRLAQVNRVVERVERGALDVRAAAIALDTAVRAAHPYPRWVATAGWAGLAASVALLLGAEPLTAVVAFVVTALIDRVGRLLNRWQLPAFFQQVCGGFLATGSTLLLFATGLFAEGTRPSLVVAAGITVLLSGLSVVGTVQDAIASYYVTAAGRAAEIALLSAGLLTGVVLALKIGFTFGVTLEVAEALPPGVGRFSVATAAAGVGAACYALAGYAPLRSLLAAGLAGAAGWATYGTGVQLLQLGPVAATGAAAVVVGAAAGLLRRRGGVQSLVVTLAGITPLLPGLVAYRGFYQLAVEGVADGLVTVTLALGIGLALAAGVALGDFITRPRRPRPGGPAEADEPVGPRAS
ncbi:threonine/serine ThrE exporter family protein [Pseudonocardia lacus]|uniref:threonine/serine ThrE exporter family protein n=1 Tax=Pseudonocardia lacus TaxID=2835865 RepID=UPI001BDC3248|nr:threonine/serine exporter family protein [Pseudonocardia lacus]